MVAAAMRLAISVSSSRSRTRSMIPDPPQFLRASHALACTCNRAIAPFDAVSRESSRYLWLARSLDAQLVTLDEKLARAEKALRRGGERGERGELKRGPPKMSCSSTVMRGLDLARPVHPSSCERGWFAGSSPAMTTDST